MKQNVIPRRRPPVQRAKLLNWLRQEIVSGRIPPGTRLPARRELQRRFKLAPATVDAAFDLLIGEGFVEARGPLGTYVAAHPPHLHEFGLVFPWPRTAIRSSFFLALEQAAKALTAGATPRKVRMFYDINGHTDTEDYQLLMSFAQSHRLAGIIFATSPYPLQGLPILEDRTIRRVAIMAPNDYMGVPGVYPDMDSLIPLALDEFVRQGRKRVALISLINEGWPDKQVTDFLHAAAARELRAASYWIQGAPLIGPEAAAYAVQAWFRAPANERPDAVLIADDNLVEAATSGLRLAGVRVPEDVTVIAHANFPHPTRSHVPAHRIGPDVTKLLEACVARLDEPHPTGVNVLPLQQRMVEVGQ